MEDPAFLRYFELSADLLGRAGFDGYIREVNPAGLRMLGWTQEQLRARPYLEFVHPEDREGVIAELARLVSEPGHVVTDYELRFEHGGGGYRWLLFGVSADIEAQVIYTVAKDITDRKEAEEAERAATERFRALTESVNDGIVAADIDGRVVLWNPAAERIFGWAHDEIVGRPLREVLPPDMHEGLEIALARQRAGKPPRLLGRTVEASARRRDGAVFPIEVSLAALGGGGRERIFVGVVRDVSERKRAERFLATQEAVMRLLAASPRVEEAMPQLLERICTRMGWQFGGWWRYDAERDELRCEALWRSDGAEFDAMERETRKLRFRLGEAWPGTVCSCRKPVWVEEIPRDTGLPRAAAAKAAALRSGVGLPVALEDEVLGMVEFFSTEPLGATEELMAMMETVTIQVALFLRRKATEAALARTARELEERAAELQRSNAELEHFAYVASHDLSEPLRVISGFVDLLERRYRGALDEQADEFLGFIKDGVRRMDDLIRGLLAYSRVGGAREERPVDVSSVAHEALDALSAAMREAEADVSIAPLPVVRGDARELRQLFQNLIGNAIKFRGPDQPRIEVAAERDDGEWRFSVVDNGIGIEPEQAERVFMIFQRLHARGEYEGTGIGLSICQKVVERHGGRIWVEPAPGGGSAFRFTLPVAEEERA